LDPKEKFLGLKNKAKGEKRRAKSKKGRTSAILEENMASPLRENLNQKNKRKRKRKETSPILLVFSLSASIIDMT
jgi:hypothetical protein